MTFAKPQPASTINWKAILWTVGIHILLLLLFLMVKYTLPVPAIPIQELGMEVNLGTDPNGSGTDQPMMMGDPAPDRSATAAPAAGAANPNNVPADDNDDPNAPSVNSNHAAVAASHPNTNPNTNHNNTQSTATTTAPPKPEKPRYVYPGTTGPGGNGATANHPGTSEGNTTGPGDRGVPHGTPGAPNYTGSPGTGTGGISTSFTDRRIVAFPPKEAEFREGGRVVIRVTVNQAGTIINTSVKSASSAELRTIALHKLQLVKFSAKPDAPAEQFGDITFVFKPRS